MENNRFFKWVWRLNGLFILLGICIIFAMSGYSVLGDYLREKPTEQIITNVAEDPSGEEKWVLGRPETFSTSEHIAIPLVSENEAVKADVRSFNFAKSGFRSSSHYRHSGTAKNILFVNGQANTSVWLFPENKQLIGWFNEFPHSSVNKKKPVPETVILYEVISKDTDQDGRLTVNDRQSLAISDTKGGGYKVVIEDVDHIVTKSLVGSSEIVIIYQKSGVGYSLKLRISDFEVVSDTMLPKVND